MRLEKTRMSLWSGKDVDEDYNTRQSLVLMLGK